MIDAGLRVLSLIEQLVYDGKEVKLIFNQDLFGYLDRMGFFLVLNPSIEVFPERPRISMFDLHCGENQNLVEISSLPPGGESKVKTLPGKLAGSIVSVLGRTMSLPRGFETEMFTVFSELIGNYFEHSESKTPGYVVAQTYPNAKNLHIAVSDSGLGILSTIRKARSKEFRGKSDTELILEVFNEGVSRFGTNVGRSCGLTRLGQISIKYAADLTIRMPGCQVYLRPGGTKMEGNYAYFRSELGALRGTHMCFKFALDKSGAL